MSEATETRQLRNERLTCGSEHLPSCYNPWINKTWCVCGSETWPGDVGSWHSVPRYDSHGEGARRVGWDTYFLPANAPALDQRSAL